MTDVYKNRWEDSYSRNENHILYPKEQCVKFLSRFVGKKIENKLINYTEFLCQGRDALDFGCGIGTQTKLLADFELIPYGVDISENALSKAKALYPELKEHFSLINGDGLLPFNDNKFAIAIAESVLDSMHFDLAKKSIKELDRVTNGYVFVSLINSGLRDNITLEETVKTVHEYGTIQSYYNDKRVSWLLKHTNLRIIKKYTVQEYDDLLNSFNDIRTYIILSNRT